MKGRILFVVNHAGFFLSHRSPLALSAARLGYEVHVATPHSKHVPRVRDAGLEWHPILLSRSGKNPWRELRTIRSLQQLYQFVKPDLVHHATSKPVLYGTPVARHENIRAVVNAISGMGHIFADDGALQRLIRPGVSLGYRFALRHPRMRIIFQNREHQAAFIARGWARESQCVLIPGSGVDTGVFAPPATPPRRDVLNVVFASRMLYTKGLREFVEAARILRSRGAAARFVLVGEPDPDNLASASRQQLDAWAAEGVVECWGRCENMPEIFARADIACLPSYSEGMPKVLIEAAACGVPLVATDIPGSRDIARHEENGLLVPVKDAGRLADAIERLLRDRELRARMGRRGRERAVSEFSLDMVVQRTMTLYETLLS
jgi:glycosyltransferase involved in cell wall biosynthesis